MAAVKILKVVDLPAPFGPNRPKVYPFSMTKELSLIAIKSLGYFLNKESTTIGLLSLSVAIFCFSFIRSYDLLIFIYYLVIFYRSDNLNFTLSMNKVKLKKTTA